jgi:hypothetical protein
MGIPATGSRDYLTLFVDEGIQLHPDMVIVSLFIGNDILEAQRNDVIRDYCMEVTKHAKVNYEQVDAAA